MCKPISRSSSMKAIRDFIKEHNKNPQPFKWRKTADQIIASVARHCQYTLELLN